MQEGRPIDGLREENAVATKRKGCPPGGWPSQRAKKEALRPPIEAATASVRPPLPGSDSAREAAEYARKVLDSYGNAIDETDEFYVDPAKIPDGWTYQWKAYEIAGKPNPYHMVAQQRHGWRAVDASRHPEIMPENFTGPIIKKGLMLMELPTVLVERAKAKLEAESRGTLRDAEAQLHETPAYTAPREEFPDRLKKVNHEIMRPLGAASQEYERE